jgi:pimeloyl-ACP methyl ester carboxylesterase
MAPSVFASEPRCRPAQSIGPRWRRALLAALALATLCSCAAPIGVQRISAREAQRDLTQSILSSGEISAKARILLHRTNQLEQWSDDPAGVLAKLHARLARPLDEFDAPLRAALLDAVAELAFAHADATGDRRYYLAAALYAWYYLFPEDGTLPSPLERGVRLSADIYNRGLTLALTDPDSGEVILRDGEYALPFGTLEIDLDESSLRWGNRELSRFASLADLRVLGLNNRYRRSGLGAPLAARASSTGDGGAGDPIFNRVRVPVTALLRFERAEGIGGEHVRGSLRVVPFTTSDTVPIAGLEVPLEVEPSAALALQLTESPPWKRELRGFFQGDLALPRQGLVSLSPYQPGKIPLVLVHGTGSSAGRWADLLNDLTADSVLRHRFQAWLFTYNTGNPIAYSGWLLRSAIRELVESLDPAGRDPALRDLVVMGHSQGGLLAKLLVVDAGDRFWRQVIDKPPEQVTLAPENREILEGSLLVEPSPFVRRVIFLSTPHGGSHLATLGPARLLARLVRSPANLLVAAGDLFEENAEAEVQRRLRRGAGSIGNMSPNSEFIQALASLPIAPGVSGHSIVGVQKGPNEEGGDGVVTYRSAHLDGVESELVVRSGHSSQSHPDVIWEVRRILLEHLSESIEEGSVDPE